MFLKITILFYLFVTKKMRSAKSKQVGEFFKVYTSTPTIIIRLES